MSRPIFDAAKFDRLVLLLDVGRAKLRGLGVSLADRRDNVGALTQSIVTGANGAALDALWPDRRNLFDLAAMPEADLLQARVDLATLRAAVRERELLDQIRAMHDELAAELAPLAQLVDRLRTYVEGIQ